MTKDLTITDIKAYATSFPLPKDGNVRLGIGRAVKKDAVMVKVTTAGGLIVAGNAAVA
jgi:hypothetical protein